MGTSIGAPSEKVGEKALYRMRFLAGEKWGTMRDNRIFYIVKNTGKKGRSLETRIGGRQKPEAVPPQRRCKPLGGERAAIKFKAHKAKNHEQATGDLSQPGLLKYKRSGAFMMFAGGEGLEPASVSDCEERREVGGGGTLS